MKLEDIKRRVDELAETAQPMMGASALQQHQGALSVMIAFYGEGSSQVKSFLRVKDQLVEKMGAHSSRELSPHAIGAIKNLKQEIDAGFTGNLEQTIAGEVLTDFIALARHILDEESSEASKNVAAVLAAAAFEDTLRRLAKAHGIPHIEKLALLLDELKANNVLKGSQVTIANGYLGFRNRALHAQWDMVDRASVSSVLGFVEELVLAHF